jgi:hypothetical protein
MPPIKFNTGTRVSGGGIGERLRITSAGLVGIGTSSPSEALHVKSTSGTQLVLERDGTTTQIASVVFKDGSGDQNRISSSDSNLIFESGAGNTERLRIDSSGRVGIGTTSPEYIFDSRGSINVSGAIYRRAPDNAILYLTNRAAQPLSFGTSDTERARIDASGRLLLGLSSSIGGAALLQVQGSGNRKAHFHQPDTGSCITQFTNSTTGSETTDGLLVGLDSTEDGMLWLYENKNLTFATNSTERMRITSAGNVGIGTTSADQLLVVSQNAASYNPAIKISNPNTGRWGGKLIFESATGAGVYDAAVIKADGGGGFGGGNLIVETAGSERCRVDGSGRLLIGTSSASYSTTVKLQGNSATSTGESRIRLCRGTASPANGDTLALLGFSDNTETPSAEIAAQRDGGTWSASSVPGRLVFSTTADGASSPTERMRITSGGYFKAAYDGNYLNASGAWHEFTGDAANGYDLRVTNDKVTPLSQYIFELRFASSTPNNSNARFIDARDSTQGRFYVLSNGGIGNFQSNDSNLCDEREKKNIEALDSTWSCLKNWELKKFHYNDDDDTNDKRYGVIAQQVAPHCPEVITEWIKQRAEEAVLDDDGNVVNPAKEEIVRMGVKEQQMMWMAIKALQEAQTRIETLEAEVAALKAS